MIRNNSEIQLFTAEQMGVPIDLTDIEPLSITTENKLMGYLFINHWLQNALGYCNVMKGPKAVFSLNGW